MSSDDELQHRLTECFGWRLLARKLRTGLNHAEIVVVMFLMERTLTYNKKVDYISEEQFMHGVYRKDGTLLTAPLGFGRSYLYRVLKGLVEQGVVIKHGKPGKPPGYQVNLSWLDSEESVNKEVHENGPPSPLQVDNLVHPTVTNQSTPGGHNNYSIHLYDTPNARAGTREASMESVNSVTTLSTRDIIMGVAAAATAKGKAARDKKKAKGNATSYEVMWNDAFRSAYPEEQVFTWTIASKASFKRALERGVPADKREAFITFVIDKWQETGTTHFKGAKSYPHYPTLPWVIRLIDTYYRAYQDEANPNRRVLSRISAGAIRTDKITAPPTNVLRADAEELEKLRKRNAELEAAAKNSQQEQALARRKTIKRLVRAKPRAAIGTDAEFVYRDDDD